MEPKPAYPRHPGWTTTPHPVFDDHYGSIIEVIYPIEGRPPHARYFGDRKNRVCTFCGRRGPEVTFKKESHALPAGLGNRHLFSLEECDECNDTDAENELMKMLEPQRVFSRIRKREGLPKLRAPGSSSFIKGVTGEPTLTIRLTEGEASPSVSIKHAGPNEIEIHHHHPPFKPISAIRSILRSAWMVMPSEMRKRHPIVISTALGKDLILPLEFFTFFLPGGIVPAVALRVFEKKTPTLPGAKVVVSLMASNTTVVWCGPTPNNSYEPTLLPPIATLPPQFSAPTSTSFKCAGDETVRVQNAKLSVHFDSKQDGSCPKPVAKAAKKEARPQLPVQLEAHVGGKVLTTIQSILVPHRFDERVARFLLPGGDLAANLTVHIEQPAGPPRLECKMDLTSVPVARVKKTLDLFDSLQMEGAFLRVITQDGKPIADLHGVSALGRGWGRAGVDSELNRAAFAALAPTEKARLPRRFF